MHTITFHNEVVKVMFLHLSVSHSVHGGGRCTCSRGVCLLWGVTCPPPSRYAPAGTPPGQVHPIHPPPGRYTPLGQVHPPPPPRPADGYCCGRYASYWNAFFFYVMLLFCFTRYHQTSYQCYSVVDRISQPNHWSSRNSRWKTDVWQRRI